MFKYKNYEYRPVQEREEDCIKTYHEVYKDGQIVMTDIPGISPYIWLTEEEFKEFVDALNGKTV